MSPPPPRTSPRNPASDNLPLQLTRFVGRDSELVDIRDKLAEQRLVTLTGTGGVGKTRLALEVAAGLRSQFADGVYLVELASLTEPRLVAHAVAAPLGFRAEAHQPFEQSLVAFLRPRRLLLVLDNCEHLVEACAHVADALLRACPHVHVLATSRQPLRIAGEWTWRVSALPVPDEATRVSPERLLEYAAVRLFVDRASATAGFALTDDVVASVARVCQRLEGIPLALELAAARVPALGVAELAGRLDDALRLLVDGSRTAPARHQTLQATIDWSYGLLTAQERTLLDRLSAFAGGFTCEAAEAIGTELDREPGPDPSTLTLLGRLVDRSLVTVETTRDGSARYRLQEVVRQYGQARLARQHALEAVQARHAAFFRDLAQRAESGVLGGQRERWQDRLELDLDNFRTARSWFVERGETESTLRLNAYLFLLLAYRGFASEGRAALREALELPGGTPAMRGRALHCLALLAYLQADYAAAAEYGRQSLDLRREVGNPAELAWSLLERGTTACAQAEYPTAVEMLQGAREASHAGGARYVFAYSLAVLGYVDSLRGEFAPARAYATRALELSRAQEFIAPTSHALATLGEVSACEGDQVEATVQLQAALDRASTPGEAYLVTRPMLALALVAIDQRDLLRAGELLSESIRLSRRLGNPHRVAQCLERVAIFAARAGHAEPWRFVDAAASIRADLAAPLSPIERRLLDERLNASDRRAGWPEGSDATWSLDRACDAAIELLTSTAAAPLPVPRAVRPRLTPREIEVAELVARGFSNREIAQTLTIAERTATSHLEHVLNKLGFHSRSQIATWVTEQSRESRVTSHE